MQTSDIQYLKENLEILGFSNYLENFIGKLKFLITIIFTQCVYVSFLYCGVVYKLVYWFNWWQCLWCIMRIK